jgi:hypothetical protein
MPPLGRGMGRQRTMPAVVICPLLALLHMSVPRQPHHTCIHRTSFQPRGRGEVAKLLAVRDMMPTSSVGAVRA